MPIEPLKSLPAYRSLTQLQCRSVRDLAWALLSPNLFLNIPDYPDDWFQQDYIDDDVLPWLVALDTAPTPLYQYLAQQRSTRLGIYFEQLLSFYFAYFPRFQLLAKNLQVNNKQRTLGEFDFIVLDKKDNQSKHIEAAIKFYLGHSPYRGEIKNNHPLYNWHHWVGPNQKDSLAIKMRHLKEHQLTLGQTEAGEGTLKKIIGNNNVASRLLIKGQFYLAYANDMSMPEFYNPQLQHQYWFDSFTFLNTENIINKQRHYAILPRSYWLSPLTENDLKEGDLLDANTFIDRMKEDLNNKVNEWHVAEIDFSNKNELESKRFFIVNHRNLPSDKSYRTR